MNRKTTGLIVGVCWFFGVSIQAGDWPQIHGVNRDGQAIDETVEPWTETPAIKWSVSCGSGYAGVAVVRQRVYLWHRLGEQEHLDCLSCEDGSQIWRTSFPAVYRGGVNPDLGPRCVPVVDSGQVIVYGAAGDLHAVDASTGKAIWSRQLRTDYDAQDGYFGAGSTPIVVDDLVITAVGGSDGASIVAVDRANGKTVWKTLDEEAAYSSPVVMTIDGHKRVVVVLRLKTVVIDPVSGEVSHEFEFGKRGPTVNAATPIVEGSQLFVTAAYGVGCRMLDLSSQKSVDLWAARDGVSSQYATPVRVGDHLFAISGREDFRSGELLCASWDNGDIKWRESSFGTAHLIAAGQRVVSQTIEGELRLFDATASGYKQLAQMTLPAGTYRSLPALSQGVMYCRRIVSASAHELVAVELSIND